MLQRLLLLHLRLLLLQLLLLLHLRLLWLQLLLLLHLRLLHTERALGGRVVPDSSNDLPTAVPLVWVIRFELAAKIARPHRVGRTILPGLHCSRRGRGSLPRRPLPILDLSLLPAFDLPWRGLPLHTPVSLAEPLHML